MKMALSFGIFAALLMSVSAETPKPNIVYILADDMGPGDVGAYNPDGKIPTPHIDRLAREGMKFMDAHTASGVCTPTRYGIMTGRYSWRTHLKAGVLGPYSPPLINSGRETVATFLKKEGYATGMVGKWHLGADWSNSSLKKSKRIGAKHVDPTVPVQNGPMDRGFDFVYESHPQCMYYIEGRQAQGELTLLTAADVEAREYVHQSPDWATDDYVQEEKLVRFATKSCEWIRSHAESPFFLYVPLTSPHNPIVPRKEFEGESKLNDHGDFVMETDWVVGEILKTLDELKLREDTIVIFTTDNGTSPSAGIPGMKKMGHYTSWIYRGCKGTLWEGGHRVPFVMRWPKSIKAGTESEQTISTNDLLATCADLFGKKFPDNVAEDSVSFLPAVKGQPIPGADERMLVHHSDAGAFAVRKGKWKLVLDPNGGSRRGRQEQIDRPISDASDLMLFDLHSDPTETVNLAASHPELVDSLQKELAAIIKAGRSTPGVPQKNDPLLRGEEWTQIEALKEFMN